MEKKRNMSETQFRKRMNADIITLRQTTDTAIPESKFSGDEKNLLDFNPSIKLPYRHKIVQVFCLLFNLITYSHVVRVRLCHYPNCSKSNHQIFYKASILILDRLYLEKSMSIFSKIQSFVLS